MIFLMIVDLAVVVRCSCPILVLLRWDAEMLGRSSLDVVMVEDDSANHAKCYSAIFSLDDDVLADAMTYQTDAVALPLDDVVVLVLLG